MPQMAPLYWTLLFTAFSSLFMLISIKTYFMFNYSIKNNFKNEEMTMKNFKWTW